MVVDDFHNAGFLQTGYGLGALVVVHENDAFPARAEQVEARERADDMLIFVKNRVGAETAFEYGVLHVGNVVVQMEHGHVGCVADMGNRLGVAKQVDSVVCVHGRGDNAGVPGALEDFRRDLRLTDYRAVHADFNGAAQHLRLVSTDDNGVFVGKEQVFAAGRQCNIDFPGDGVADFPAPVENLPLQNRNDIVNRHGLNHGIVDTLHVVVGDIPGGEHAEQGAVLVDHGQDGDMCRLHGLGGAADGRGWGNHRRRVEIKVTHLIADVVNEDGRLGVEAVKYQLRFVADASQTRRDIVSLAQGVFERGVGQRGDDGVGIGVFVSGDVDGFHEKFLLVAIWAFFRQYSTKDAFGQGKQRKISGQCPKSGISARDGKSFQKIFKFSGWKFKKCY